MREQENNKVTQGEILDSISTYGFITIQEYAEDTSFIKKRTYDDTLSRSRLRRFLKALYS